LDNIAVLKVLRLLYNVLEAGNYWFRTYYKHYIKHLYIQQLTYDPCLLQSNASFGVVGLQTDDTLFLANKAFVIAEQEELYKAGFIAKDCKQLTAETLLKFNSSLI
jgi:hypothetical protein